MYESHLIIICRNLLYKVRWQCIERCCEYWIIWTHVWLHGTGLWLGRLERLTYCSSGSTVTEHYLFLTVFTSSPCLRYLHTRPAHSPAAPCHKKLLHDISRALLNTKSITVQVTEKWNLECFKIKWELKRWPPVIPWLPRKLLHQWTISVIDVYKEMSHWSG